MGGLEPSIDKLLEETSRSFYLTLNKLPSGVRKQMGLLYLLARIADTIADSNSGTTEELLETLESYNDRAQGLSDSMPDMSNLAKYQKNPAEARLLSRAEEPIQLLFELPERDREIIRTCLGIIVGGQSLDLQRFGAGKVDVITPLRNYDELDDYAYRVAGSVGEFWTSMSLEHQFKVNSETEKKLFEKGVRFGKALQLINILRDIPEDLRLGRCYIPLDQLESHGLVPEDLEEPGNMEKFRELFDQLLDRAEEHLDSAIEYIEMLPYSQFRLRGACMLPVLIGQRTISLLRDDNVLDGENRVKISRDEIKELTKKTVLSISSKKRCSRLLNSERR
ncbi:MAG: phytoene/squalene synthase family protein [Candidatus Thalassarchaeaceae archaeon]|jgi:farnesyl-diphosphate farnesyltransferase|nr:farnesyl-diphosphate farnesyltransferase [Euryarchaeota archaeon]MDP6870917.1 phytoene/squalene synthase family protein [Candidatus Thalassarchaeaceae archaeon]